MKRPRETRLRFSFYEGEFARAVISLEVCIECNDGISEYGDPKAAVAYFRETLESARRQHDAAADRKFAKLMAAIRKSNERIARIDRRIAREAKRWVREDGADVQ